MRQLGVEPARQAADLEPDLLGMNIVLQKPVGYSIGLRRRGALELDRFILIDHTDRHLG